ncbi:unnamed protein product [Parascedosporium putredinis]|uniref:BOD1/SHG1 domain-containing protein n=1 Tax=Parascedosporium putredinis TaxID=1442378 RepID=A0A9P1M937_9PEZI|nr:unnamed protein product [Parascedosporium putredinis]CAI7994961.1 unnamed protein product [Parascedosporium putredinis]
MLGPLQRAIESLANGFKKKGDYDAIRKQVWDSFETSGYETQVTQSILEVAEQEIERNPNQLLTLDRGKAAALIDGALERSGIYQKAQQMIEKLIDTGAIEQRIREIRRTEIGHEEAVAEQLRGSKTDEEYVAETTEKQLERQRVREELRAKELAIQEEKRKIAREERKQAEREREKEEVKRREERDARSAVVIGAAIGAAIEIGRGIEIEPECMIVRKIETFATVAVIETEIETEVETALTDAIGTGTEVVTGATIQVATEIKIAGIVIVIVTATGIVTETEAAITTATVTESGIATGTRRGERIRNPSQARRRSSPKRTTSDWNKKLLQIFFGSQSMWNKNNLRSRLTKLSRHRLGKLNLRQPLCRSRETLQGRQRPRRSSEIELLAQIKQMIVEALRTASQQLPPIVASAHRNEATMENASPAPVTRDLEKPRDSSRAPGQAQDREAKDASDVSSPIIKRAGDKDWRDRSVDRPQRRERSRSKARRNRESSRSRTRTDDRRARERSVARSNVIATAITTVIVHDAEIVLGPVHELYGTNQTAAALGAGLLGEVAPAIETETATEISIGIRPPGPNPHRSALL